MLVRPDEKVPIARLLTFLEYGERLAQECAARQAAVVRDTQAGRFLKSQARQEAMHARVFRGAIAWLAPRHLGDAPFLPALEEYRKKLDDAFLRQDFYETILAEQIILEGVGEATLHRIEQGLEKRGAPFKRLRRVLLHQEEAHHAFGERMINRAWADGRVELGSLRRKAQDYLALTEQMVLTLSNLFESIDENPVAWADDMRKFLPEWLAREPMGES